MSIHLCKVLACTTTTAVSDCPSARLQVTELQSVGDALYMESVDSRHSSHSFTSTIASKLELANPPLRLDSQCKYGLLARGDGNIFMRFPAATYRCAYYHVPGCRLGMLCSKSVQYCVAGLIAFLHDFSITTHRLKCSSSLPNLAITAACPV